MLSFTSSESDSQMLFNSLQFCVFFPAVTALFFLLPHRYRWAHLLLASCLFYCAFIPVYLLILIFTIIVDYFAGIAIESASGARKRVFLGCSLAANVGVLAVFKYFNFAAANLNDLAATFGLPPGIPLLDIVLPIGLSFHTFQAMSYIIEVYRGQQRAERHFGIYALYVLFYPQLVAGPIERPQNLLHQFHEEHPFVAEDILRGWRLMLWGFFKKVVVADRLAIYVNIVYASPAEFHWLNLALATLAFSVQIYCDFSGYSDIAIGAAKSMGFHLMTNFHRPYFSKNIQEFWKRWHISLSTWFKDYLYVSLGGNRGSTFRTYINLATVFLVSGLWHGANWTFVAWGAVHAAMIVAYLLWRRFSSPKWLLFPGAAPLSVLATFVAVTLAWVFFRAASMTDALAILSRILTLDAQTPFQAVVRDIAHNRVFGATSAAIALLGTAALVVVEHAKSPRLEELDAAPVSDLAFCSLTAALIVVFGVFNNTGFIYFQF